MNGLHTVHWGVTPALRGHRGHRGGRRSPTTVAAYDSGGLRQWRGRAAVERVAWGQRVEAGRQVEDGDARRPVRLPPPVGRTSPLSRLFRPLGPGGRSPGKEFHGVADAATGLSKA